MKNVPDIRFKGFEKEWKTYILSSIGNFRSNGVDKKIYNDEQIVNLLNYMDVYNYRKITSKNCIDLMKVSATKKQIKDCNIIKGDIFFTPSSETPDEIGYVMSIEETLPNTCYSYHLMRFRPFDRILYLSFADYCFSSNYFRGQMKFKAKGVQRFILSKPDFESLEALLPSYEEQETITCLFKAIDNVINDCKKKIASLKQLKSACLISMFPQQGETVPRVRFKGFDGEWKNIKLKDILVERHEMSTITFFLPQLSFTISEGVIKPENRKTNKRDFLIKDKENKKYIVTKIGDIIYNPANVVFGAIHRNNLCDGVVSPIYKIFYSEEDTKFVECIVRNPAFINKLTLYTEGTVTKLKTLKPESFLDMEVCITNDKAEQHQIASYFRNLDIQISEQEKRLEKLKQIKAACLDKMFM
ncbi:MAG: restriction endonuclease subunit S [Prevotella sp.]|nr:restriction endonuclease subunit S [Prevotella sp.]